MAHDVFISYASDNKAIGDAVCAALERQHIRCWIAPRDVLPGHNFAQMIIEAIHSARVFVLVFSAASNASVQVQREVDRAVSCALPILPLRVEDVVPSDWLEYYLAGQHWLDALTLPLERHLARLCEAIAVLLEPTTTEAPPLPEEGRTDDRTQRPAEPADTPPAPPPAHTSPTAPPVDTQSAAPAPARTPAPKPSPPPKPAAPKPQQMAVPATPAAAVAVSSGQIGGEAAYTPATSAKLLRLPRHPKTFAVAVGVGAAWVIILIVVGLVTR